MEICRLSIYTDAHSSVRRMMRFFYHLYFTEGLKMRLRSSSHPSQMRFQSLIDLDLVCVLHRNSASLSLYPAYRKCVLYHPATPWLISLHFSLCLLLEPDIFLVSIKKWKLNVKLVSDISEDTELKNRNMTRRDV